MSTDRCCYEHPITRQLIDGLTLHEDSATADKDDLKKKRQRRAMRAAGLPNHKALVLHCYAISVIANCDLEQQSCWCMGVATCYRQLYRLVPILFTPVQLCTFLNFLEIFYVLYL